MGSPALRCGQAVRRPIGGSTTNIWLAREAKQESFEKPQRPQDRFRAIAGIAKDLVIRLQSSALRIALCFLGIAQSALFALRLTLFEQSYSYARHCHAAS